MDAELCGERWLLVVIPDGGVIRFDVGWLVGNDSSAEVLEQVPRFSPVPARTQWESRIEESTLVNVG